MDFYLRRYRKHFLLVIFFGGLFWAFLHLRNQGVFSEWNLIDRLTVRVGSTTQEWTRDITRGLHTLWSRYVALVGTKKENERLLTELGQLKEKILQLQEIENENDRLRKLILFSERLTTRYLPAQVIAENLQGELRTLRINRGKKDHVRVGAAVVTSAGVVGRILRSDEHTADVLSIVDANANVDAVVQRTRARGVTEGHSVGQLSMKYLQRDDDVTEGDTVVTSGMGGDYPKGIVVGYVSHVSRKAYGISQSVSLSPSVDFSKIEEVFVLMGSP